MEIERNDHFDSHFNALQLAVLESGYARLDSSWRSDEGVCSPFNRFYFIMEGAGAILSGGREIPLCPGRVYLIPFGVTFRYRCDGQLCKLYFHFTVTCPNGFDLFADAKSVWELPAQPEELIRLQELYHAGGLAELMEAREYLYGTAARFVRLTHGPGAGPRQYSALLREVFPLIRENLTLRTDAAALARRMSVSKSVLSKRFREETGMPLGRYIDCLLFQKAQRMLLTTEDPIGRIAEELGFCDQYYFSRYFKLRQNEPPSRYRKRLSGRT